MAFKRGYNKKIHFDKSLLRKKFLRENKSTRVVAKEMGTSQPTVRKWLRNLGIDPRQTGGQWKFTLDDRLKMAKLYESGKSLYQIAKIYGIDDEDVRYTLKDLGIERRDRAEATRKAIALPIDHTFFDKINTEEKAYWLGFLTADGCVGDNDSVQLCLAIVDKRHVEKFRSALKSKHKISSNKRRAAFGPYSARLARGLAKLGIVPRKTFIAHPCTKIPKNLLRHYWRGLVDGDGSVGYRYIALTGTKSICSAFLGYLRSLGIKTKTKVHPVKNSFVVGISSKEGGRAGKILYEGATIYLTRKMKSAEANL